jgi:hypothetical protein
MTVDRLVYHACLLFSAIMALVHIKGLKSRQLFVLAPLLWWVLIQEISLAYIILDSPTGVIYNIYRPASICVFAYIFYRVPFNTVQIRRLIAWMVGVYLVIVVFTFCFIQTVRIYNWPLSFAGGFVATCCGIIFLFNYFLLDDPEAEKKWQPLIWIAFGIVMYYPIANIVFAFNQYIYHYKASIAGTVLYNAVPRTMSIFMYSCFGYAFYLCRKEN